VRDADNPLVAHILRRFRDRPGIPILIDTSCNMHEEPIVNRPRNAGGRWSMAASISW